MKNEELKMKGNSKMFIKLGEETVKIDSVKVVVDSPTGKRVIILSTPAELSAIEPYQEVIQGMADAYTAMRAPNFPQDEVAPEQE